MLCWFLTCINMNQSQVYICFFPIKAPSQPIPPLYVVTEHQVEFPMVISNFPLAICFTNGNVYISLLLSQFIPPSPAPAMSISLFSMSESLLYHFKQVHQYHFSRFYLYALIYDTCFSLSDLFHCITGSRFIHITGTDSNPSLFDDRVIFHCIYVPQLLFFYYQLEANYFTILQWLLSYIDKNQPWFYMYSPSRSPLPPPSLPDPSGSSQCTRSKRLSHASNLGW